MQLHAGQFTAATLVDYVRDQVNEQPKPTPENTFADGAAFYFHQDMPHSPYLIQRNLVPSLAARLWPWAPASSDSRSDVESSSTGGRAVIGRTGWGDSGGASVPRAISPVVALALMLLNAPALLPGVGADARRSTLQRVADSRSRQRIAGATNCHCHKKPSACCRAI